MKFLVTAAALAGCAIATPAAAEVLDASPAGFSTRNVVRVAATPAEAWAALTDPAQYWNREHSWSLDEANFSLDPRAGGCFCEALPAADGFPAGSVEHMRVIHAASGSMLRMSGALGPLQGEALTGTLTVTLAPVGDGTELAWEYLVTGYARFDLVELAPAVDGVIGEQAGRLAGLLGRLED